MLLRMHSNHQVGLQCTCLGIGLPIYISDADEAHVQILRERYLCPHFRILVIGRANAGKTTILEKVCAVAKGTKPTIHDNDGELV